MRKTITCLALLALISCKDDTVKPINGTEINETSVDSSGTGMPETVKKQLSFEEELADAGAAIEKSTPENRRELLYKYLSYSDKTDGATGEAFVYFTYHYEDEHRKEFYSVLTEKDTAFVRQWAENAAGEAILGIETHAEAEAMVQDIEDNKPIQSKVLNDSEKRLYLLYTAKLVKGIMNAFSEKGE